MADFNEQLPDWQEAGIEPPSSKKTTGWAVNDKPPAGWLNWLFNRTYKVLSEIRSVFSAHKADTTVHLTAAERTAWNNKASINSPALTGTPTGPTPAADTSSKQLATAEFVLNQAGTAVPGLDLSFGQVGASKKYAREDHLHPATYPYDYRTAASLPSTYPVGSSIFFALNESGAGWPATFGTIHTIRGYGGAANAMQYFYPYNNAAPVKFRISYYTDDVWGNWMEVITSGGPSVTTLIPNLNSDLLHGMQPTPNKDVSTIMQRDSNGSVAVNQIWADKLLSNAPQGTAPLAVASTTAVPNLNVDLLDGAHASATSTAGYIPIRDANKKIAEVAANRAVAKEVVLDTTSAKVIASYTAPSGITPLLSVKVSLVTAAARNVNIIVTYTSTGGTVITEQVLPATDMAVGRYYFIPLNFVCNPGTVNVVATSKTAGSAYVSAVITEEG